MGFNTLIGSVCTHAKMTAFRAAEDNAAPFLSRKMLQGKVTLPHAATVHDGVNSS